MKIAVIGAGPSGLVSLKYALHEGHDCVIFEQSGTLGGTWVYTDKTGVDENGIPIHSSMYKGMRTNLPKEIMAFLDYPYPKDKINSYLDHEDVLKYLNRYAVNFNLQNYIKYFKCVTLVEPLSGLRWSLKVKDVISGLEEVYEYNSVFVCNGHYSTPFVPKLIGQNVYSGTQIHSHNYRTAEHYKNKRVLVVGGGSSGADIALKISVVAKHVFWSIKYDTKIISNQNLSVKPLVMCLYENKALFKDNTTEEVDVILYCTGYTYTYPFLSKACGISVQDNWVRPLFKHIVNINFPTMFFIGIPFLVPIIPVCDIQVRFALAELKNKFLPSQKSMLEELQEYVKSNELKNIPMRHYHKIGDDHLEEYLLELSESASVQPIPSVIIKLYARARMNKNLEDCFQIIEEDSFLQLPC